MSDNVSRILRMAARTNPNIRVFRLRCGKQPKACELSRFQLQGACTNTTIESSAVVEHINALAGPNVTTGFLRGVEPGTVWRRRRLNKVLHSDEGISCRYRGGRYLGGGEGAGGEGTRCIPRRLPHEDVLGRSYNHQVERSPLY